MAGLPRAAREQEHRLAPLHQPEKVPGRDWHRAPLGKRSANAKVLTDAQLLALASRCGRAARWAGVCIFCTIAVPCQRIKAVSRSTQGGAQLKWQVKVVQELWGSTLALDLKVHGLQKIDWVSQAPRRITLLDEELPHQWAKVQGEQLVIPDKDDRSALVCGVGQATEAKNAGARKRVPAAEDWGHELRDRLDVPGALLERFQRGRCVLGDVVAPAGWWLADGRLLEQAGKVHAGVEGRVPRVAQGVHLQEALPAPLLEQGPQPGLLRAGGQEPVLGGEDQQRRREGPLPGHPCPQLACDGLAAVTEPPPEAEAQRARRQQLGKLLRVGQKALHDRVDAGRPVALHHGRHDARGGAAELPCIGDGRHQCKRAQVRVRSLLRALAHLLHELGVGRGNRIGHILRVRQGGQHLAQQRPRSAPKRSCRVHQHQPLDLPAQSQRHCKRHQPAK
mmetsp:Transcript_500/g.1513  ORF Transcript_500/g.1513 Transcript_500/m.1513 type:complete len:449 (+) Transcript_500:968-2314(+)